MLSVKFNPVNGALPVFSNVIVYLIISPELYNPSPLSITSKVFVASILGVGSLKVMVGSSVVFPSVSSPSSEISVTLSVNPSELAYAVTELLIYSELKAMSFIIKDAV